MYVVPITSALTVTTEHKFAHVVCTSGTFSVSLTALANISRKFWVTISNPGSGVITVDPDGSESILTPNGSVTTLTLAQGESVSLVCDGSQWIAVAQAQIGHRAVVKASDESITTDTTLSNDAALKFEMAVNAKYAIRLKVHYTTGTVENFKYALTGPSSPTLVRVMRKSLDPGSLTAAQTNGFDNAYTGSTAIVGTAVEGFIEMDILVHNGANAGTFAFQWAQNTSGGTATKVLAGSVLEYAKV